MIMIWCGMIWYGMAWHGMAWHYKCLCECAPQLLGSLYSE